MSAPTARLVLGLVGFVLIGWGIGELWVSVIGSSETELMRELAAQRSQSLIQIARAVTWAGSAFLLVPLALVCALVFGRAGMWPQALAVVLGLGGAMLIADLVKILVSRSRPPVEHLQAVTGFSFPSGHTTQAAAFWLSLVLALRAGGAARTAVRLAGAAAMLLILIVAWSRVYLGVHYPSDVLAGLLLGAGWATYVAWTLREPWRGPER